MPSEIKVTNSYFACVKDEDSSDPYKEVPINTKGYKFVKGKFYGGDYVEKNVGTPVEIKVDIPANLFNDILDTGVAITINSDGGEYFGIQNIIQTYFDKYKSLRNSKIPKEMVDDETFNNQFVIEYTKKTDKYKLVILDSDGLRVTDSSGNVLTKEDSSGEIDLEPNYAGAPGAAPPTTPAGALAGALGFGPSSLQQGTPTDPTVQSIVNTIGQPFGVSPQNLQIIAHWITNNPTLSTAIIGIGAVQAAQILGPLLFGASGLLSGALGGGLGKVLTYGAIAAALYKFGPQIMQALGSVVGGALGGGGQGVIPFLGGALLGPDAMGTFIVYDGGKEVDNKSTAPYQRCLIRLGKGNLAMERANLQPPAYNPVIGIKIPGKKNYADDGRFGQWTLDASRNMFQTINTLNKDKIKDNPKFEIKDPARVPVEILISPACVGNTQMNPTAAEQQAFEATKKVPAKKPEPKNLPESKVYKEYGFLSTKNEKLHSVLMEQLKKDLKRG